MIARFLVHIRSASEEDKSNAVEHLIKSSTLSTDFFVLVALSSAMATLGLLEGSPAIVIGSMLIAPVLYPILTLALSVSLADRTLIMRSGNALVRSMGLALLVSTLTALLFGIGIEPTPEVLARTAPSLLSVLVAVISGFAVAYAVARPNLSATLPGVAVAVSLIPPLGVVGIGISLLSWPIVSGALVMFLVNVGALYQAT